MRTASLVLIATLLALNLPAGTTQATEDPKDEGHSFDCGPDVPPSGIYLEYETLIQAFHYDCRTKILVPYERTASACVSDVEDGQYIPLYGICIGTSDVLEANGEKSQNAYQLDVLLAFIGESTSYHWRTFYGLDGNEVSEFVCADAPCSPDPGCVKDLIVTYCRETATRSIICPEQAVWMEGGLVTVDRIGAVSVGEGRATALCA